jgi:hypothetical protein
MYTVDTGGTRPILVINEASDILAVIYAASTGGGDIVYKDTSLVAINFRGREVLIPGGIYTDSSSLGVSFVDDLVVIASGSGSRGATVGGVRLQRPVQP